jgi:hypothetical protein
MTQRKVATMAADRLWKDWCQDIDRIHRDSYELFFLRRQFREISEMYQGNERLQQVGGNLWLWLQNCYASTALIRLRREADSQGNSVSLWKLLDEISKRPDVITRGRIAARNPKVSALIAHMIDDGFTKNWAERSAKGTADDQIDASKVKADRKRFEKLMHELDRVTSTTLAHRPRSGPWKALTTVKNVSKIFSEFEDLLKKYIGLLKGSYVDKLEPTAQYDTLEVFTFPWHPKAYAEWERLTREAETGEDRSNG